MGEVTALVAFVAGMLSFLSPCVFPLLPAYVSQMTDAVVVENRVEVDKRTLFIRTISFIIGFSSVFVFMGLSASFIGQLFISWRPLLGKIAGLLIVIFGLQMAGLLNLRFLNKEMRYESKRNRGKGALDSLLMGLAFGTGWTPCVGLALTSILMLAGASDTMVTGMILLLIYSIGLGIPFLILSLIVTYSFSFMKRINRVLPVLSRINGWILIAMGILLFSGQLQKISAWLSQYSLFTI